MTFGGDRRRAAYRYNTTPLLVAPNIRRGHFGKHIHKASYVSCPDINSQEEVQRNARRRLASRRPGRHLLRFGRRRVFGGLFPRQIALPRGPLRSLTLRRLSPADGAARYLALLGVNSVSSHLLL